MACTLYTYPNNFRAQKALIAAQYSGTAVNVPEDFSLGETNKTAEFLKKFPNGKVPALETPDKKYLSESNAIAFYVGNDELNGKTQFEKAQILMWINFAESEVLPPSCTWVFPCLGLVQFNKQSTEKSKEDVKRILQILNDHLLHSTYLVGERITQADISVVCNLLSLYQLEMCTNPDIASVYFLKLVIYLEPTEIPKNQKKFGEVQKELGQGKPAKERKLPCPPKDNKRKKSRNPNPKKEEAAAEEPDETELPPWLREPKSKDPFEKFPKGKKYTLVKNTQN
ncbi:Elongation factor 1-gamma [Araneus ventricosus]|uniref:Elongation factor 1-gamma n=1 Tax=Araneus ventricosus TaxID=182803 RepID=A0A4Y2RGI7_ARAVE|nr:Elongation factor 1-gamma [Araneus ventricosus]